MATPEILYALDFAALKIPALLENETVHCRRARTDDLEMLVEWRAAYYAEALFAQNNEALLERARDEISFGISAGDIFALESGPKAGRILPMVVYNAKLSDIVQIGGVWTLPDLRGKGYGRAATAGALLAGRETGVSKGVFFTPTSSFSAQKAYESIGF